MARAARCLVATRRLASASARRAKTETRCPYVAALCAPHAARMEPRRAVAVCQAMKGRGSLKTRKMSVT